jgi:hypothetical protein
MIESRTGDGCWDVRIPNSATILGFGDYADDVTDAVYCKVNLVIFFYSYDFKIF